MLIYLSIENYKSFKEKTTIDFRSTGISELRGNILPGSSDRLLKSISIMGPNASGKSNILKGFLMFRYFIVNALSFPLDEIDIPVDPFRLSLDTNDEPTLIEMEIVVDGKRYIYGMRMKAEAIHQEWLFERLATTTSLIFTREYDEFKLGKSIEEAQQILQFVNAKTPFLSVGTKFNIDIFKKITDWYINIGRVDGLQSEDYMGFACTILENPELKARFLNLVKAADIGISDIRLERPAEDDKSVRIKTIHKIFDIEGREVGEEVFDLSEEESKGTRKYFSLIGMIINSIDRGNLLVIDELDSRLHGDLVNEILRLYNSPLNTESQLLNVNLQPSILEPKLLRRDQVYLVEKDIFGASHLTSMVEFDIRKSQSMAKQYRDRRVGARPVIENFEKVFAGE